MTAPQVTLTAPVGDGPTIVLGPSLGTSTILWQDVVPRLSSRFRIVLWDLPGHGASPIADAPFSVGELADAVAAAVRPLAGPVHYAGVSLGGAVGMHLALRHPDTVARLVVVASGATLSTPEAWHERAELVRARSTSALIAASSRRWFAPETPARRPALTGALLHALQDTDDDSYALCCLALAGHDLRDELALIAPPTLAAWGRFDEVAPEEKAREIADGVRSGRASRIDGAAHLPPAEQPEAMAELLTRFIDERGAA